MLEAIAGREWRKPMHWAVLAACALAVTLAWQTPAVAQGDPAVIGPETASRKIKDPAEYDAYTQAMNQADPAQHAAAMEAFVDKFPNSLVKVDALQQALAAYQRLGDEAKVAATAQQILEESPRNLRALAILTALERERANSGDAAALGPMSQHADKGLAELPAWTKPDDMGEETFKSLHDAMTSVFEGAHAFVLLQAKDYGGASRSYMTALAIDPSDLVNAYQLGVAELHMTPPRVDGFWWLARAVELAGEQHNDAVQTAISNYAKGKYDAYHGSDDGWNDIVLDAVGKPKPPDDFSVSAAGK